MKPFAFKKASEETARMTAELSPAEMTAAKGAGGPVDTYYPVCHESCWEDYETMTSGCSTICDWVKYDTEI